MGRAHVRYERVCVVYIIFVCIQGIAVRRHEKGLWISVASVRDDTPAQKSCLKKGDFIRSINGRIVFHLKPEDVSRLIKNSGKVMNLICIF